MSDATDTPTGSLRSTLGYALLYGSIILLALYIASQLGWISRLDATLEAWLTDLMDEKFVHTIPSAVLWIMTVLMALGLPALLMNCRHGWQRLTVWLIALAVLALWAPVLCLSAHRPQISLVWLAAAAAGLLVTLHLFRMARAARNS